jgi:uncharacterized short protein YbdD (DUF466 family)
MGRAAEIAGQIGWYFSKLSWYSATLMGDNHYRCYAEHRRRTHPGEPILTEREYWRMRHAATEANPNTRCC